MTEKPSRGQSIDWRDDSIYDAIRGIDRAGLMWEWLRRDAGYVDWYASASKMTRGESDPAHWGVHFR